MYHGVHFNHDSQNSLSVHQDSRKPKMVHHGITKIPLPLPPPFYTKQSDDEDIASIFISKLNAFTKKIYKDYYKRPKPLKITTQEQEEF